jgi:hypothetical protein
MIIELTKNQSFHRKQNTSLRCAAIKDLYFTLSKFCVKQDDSA